MAAQTHNQQTSGQTAGQDRRRQAYDHEVVVETRSGMMRGFYAGMERRSGSWIVLSENTFKSYHFRPEACTVVPAGLTDTDAYARHVARTYDFIYRADHILCCHPTDATRRYELRWNIDAGQWTCTCPQARLRSMGPCKHIKAAELVGRGEDAEPVSLPRPGQATRPAPSTQSAPPAVEQEPVAGFSDMVQW